MQFCFDLDLTYIADNLIAFSVPVEGIRQAYMNPLSEIARFFNTFHMNKYRIFNSSPEYTYPHEAFDNRVVSYPTLNRMPPTMSDIIKFLKDARQFTDENEENVIAIHCDDGTGRTGVLCCSWLLFSKTCFNARESLRFFSNTRTDMRQASKLQGVDTPSQKRYVQCVDQLLTTSHAYCSEPHDHLICPPAAPLYLKEMAIDNLFNKPKWLLDKRFVLVVQQAEVGSLIWKTLLQTEPIYCAKGESIFNLESIEVAGDIRVSMYNVDMMSAGTEEDFGTEKGLLFYFVFHTAFVNFETNRLSISYAHMDLPPRRFLESLGCASIAPFNTHGTTTMYFTGSTPWYDEEGEPIGISDAAKEKARARKLERLKNQVTEVSDTHAVVGTYEDTKQKLVNFISAAEEKFKVEKQTTQLDVEIDSSEGKGDSFSLEDPASAGKDAENELPTLAPPFSAPSLSIGDPRERQCGARMCGGPGWT